MGRDVGGSPDVGGGGGGLNLVMCGGRLGGLWLVGVGIQDKDDEGDESGPI